MTTITLHNYQSHYFSQLAQVYSDAVIEQASPVYRPEQIAMWADYPSSHPADFAALLKEGTVLMALSKSHHVVGFGQLNPRNYVSLLYVLRDYSRQGIATTIYNQLEHLARIDMQSTISVTASKVSKPLFEKLGFELIEDELSLRNNIEFERFIMVKPLL
jgi:putative acetyltransferase